MAPFVAAHRHRRRRGRSDHDPTKPSFGFGTRGSQPTSSRALWDLFFCFTDGEVQRARNGRASMDWRIRPGRDESNVHRLIGPRCGGTCCSRSGTTRMQDWLVPGMISRHRAVNPQPSGVWANQGFFPCLLELQFQGPWDRGYSISWVMRENSVRECWSPVGRSARGAAHLILYGWGEVLSSTVSSMVIWMGAI